MDLTMTTTLVTKALQPSKSYHLAKTVLQSQQNGHKGHNSITITVKAAMSLNSRVNLSVQELLDKIR